MSLEFGIDTFGDVTWDAQGRDLSHGQVIRNVIEEAKLADAVGLDIFGLGEHHRDDFAVSAPDTILAAIAAVTSKIKLTSAVTVLSSDDPIRVFQRFSTIQAISNGRAEVTLGRGSFTESFPLFGFDLSDYEMLFEEKFEIFSKLTSEEKISWSGRHRTPLKSQAVYPRPEKPIPVWVGVGGTPESVVRAATNNMSMSLAIIGGPPARFAPYAGLYREVREKMDAAPLPIGCHSPGHIAATDQEARDRFFDGYRVMHQRIGRTRGWPPLTRDAFEHEVENGALYVGSPDTVARKIAATVKALDVQRFDLKYSAGPVSHEVLMDSIRLYGEEVVPQVRAILGLTT
ncbi:probable oxidoreductase, LLM family [Celeribacter baekdonensis]|jgi:probable LLM family oxidoreductase|uniref:Probable oxidoreductase, LLM family n=1 Tax=Celeribacter baekdonensis TaxID=875171 RepID=A0A1G7N2Q6_9RHOB|nr:LLM class flavin-dependent oxidoreductase [Celeribacter baekdonensis]SDF68348.1 probable oxidoreductase, LLM family [Celeribacter baekdonensis]